MMTVGPKRAGPPRGRRRDRGDGPAGLVSLTIEHNYRQQATKTESSLVFVLSRGWDFGTYFIKSPSAMPKQIP
jgi:hypothetical protein